MANPILYGSPLSNFVRTARIAFHEKGVAYDLEPDINVMNPDPDYLAISPFGRIPALRHGDITMFESLAIATYVDKAFDGPALVPADAVGAARTMQWVYVFNDIVAQHLGRGVIFERLAKPNFDMVTDEDKIRESMPRVEKILDVVDGALAKDPYLGGADPTLADAYYIAQLFYAVFCPDTEALMASKKNIGAWMERMNQRDSVQATVPVLPGQAAA